MPLIKKSGVFRLRFFLTTNGPLFFHHQYFHRETQKKFYYFAGDEHGRIENQN